MSTARVNQAAISTSHHLATEAGAAALEQGGNAVDAALAAAATLCVVYPNQVALGGDLVAIVRSPDGRVRFLNATGAAPAAESLENLRSRHGTELPDRGVDTITIPGGVGGWAALHELAAQLPWAAIFERPIGYAQNGVPVASSVAATIAGHLADLEQDAGCRELLVPGGVPLREGDDLRQPALADSLRLLAAGGGREFYTGELARRWLAGLQASGSQISLDDTASYSPEWAEPLGVEHRGHRVLTSPPNTSGFILIRALRAIAGADGGPGIADPLGTGALSLARAFRDGNAVRAAALADPRQGGASGDELIAMVAPPPAKGVSRPTGDTVGLSAYSSDGWAISLVNSLYNSYGAAVREQQTGIFFQNRGTAFSLDPASPNAFAPRKRPRHTLMPVLVLRGDETAWVPASMGGLGQPQIHTHLLTRLLDGATPVEATHAPRWVVNEPSDDGTVPVTVEADVEQSVQDALAAEFRLNIVPPYSEVQGHSNVIEVGPDGLSASSDPRSDGSAIVVE